MPASIQEHCHCTSYGIKPYATRTADLAAFQADGTVVFRTLTGKGREFISNLAGAEFINEDVISKFIERKHSEAVAMLDEANRKLPDFKSTGLTVS